MEEAGRDPILENDMVHAGQRYQTNEQPQTVGGSPAAEEVGIDELDTNDIVIAYVMEISMVR